MIAEFERGRFSVSGRQVTVTSWFDDRTRVWFASAPAYSHLFDRGADPSGGAASRQDAVARVLRVLTEHYREIA